MSKIKLSVMVPIIIAEPTQQSKNMAKANLGLSAPVGAQPDLMFMRSVLVSTGANKNDDVFLPDEMWKARATPVLKPVDWEHNTGRELTEEEIAAHPGMVVAGNQIIGVMYNSYATDENGVIIDEDKSSASDFEIPENFHIVDEAVIYKGLFPKAAERVEKGAAANQLFVSMETWFDGYDYLVGNKVVARNEETAFLEKNLKANGGDGVFGNDKVKRALRGLTFGGKGIVERPANEPSVIQSVTHEPMSASSSQNRAIASNIISKLEESNLRIKTEDSKMADSANDTKVTASGPSFDDYKAVTQELAEVRTEKKTQASELEATKAERDELKSQADSIKTALTKGGSVLEEALPGVTEKLANADVAQAFDVIADAVKAHNAEASEKVDAAEAKAAKAEKELGEMQASVRAGQRLSKIQSELNLSVSSDDSDDTAKAKVAQAQRIAEETKSLDDEAFASQLQGLKSLLSLAAKPPFPPKKKDEDKKDKKEDKMKEDAGITNASILDAVKASEQAPAAGDESANVGLDLDKAYAGLVGDLLNSHKKDN